MQSDSDVESMVGSEHPIGGNSEPPGRGSEEDAHDAAYAAKVGARLRAIRRQKNYSLQHVEAISRDEFKASVLGAYERGERAISVPRLQRLARLYQVPVDQMLPPDNLGQAGASAGDQALDVTDAGRQRRRPDRPVTIDLTAVEQLRGQEVEMIARYLRTIQIQRGDYNGRMLTIRRDDLRAVACVLDCPPDEVPARLTRLGLSLVR